MQRGSDFDDQVQRCPSMPLWFRITGEILPAGDSERRQRVVQQISSQLEAVNGERLESCPGG